jgi:hypothetical protein
MPLRALRPAMAAGLARRHWLLVILLLAGLVLRVTAQVAYRPALLYIDTIKYLFGVWPGADPHGYEGLLKAILAVGTRGTVAALQHLLGVAMAVAIYAVLTRRGTPRWLAALAAGPVLLDAYQLQMEQTIMPDVWFEAIVVAGLAVLLWRPAVTLPAAAAAGLLLGSSATIRQLGEILVLPAVVYLVVAGGGWRRVAGTCAALAAAFALPILAYCTVSDVTTGAFPAGGRPAQVGPDGRGGRLRRPGPAPRRAPAVPDPGAAGAGPGLAGAFQPVPAAPGADPAWRPPAPADQGAELGRRAPAARPGGGRGAARRGAAVHGAPRLLGRRPGAVPEPAAGPGRARDPAAAARLRAGDRAALPRHRRHAVAAPLAVPGVAGADQA